MSAELGPFPVDDATLMAVQHALNAAVTFDEDGKRRLVGAEYDLPTLLDFLSDTMGEDPDAEVIDPGDPDVVDPDGVPGFLAGISGAKIVVSDRMRYSDHDVIRALVDEIFRLRGAGSVGTDKGEKT